MDTEQTPSKAPRKKGLTVQAKAMPEPETKPKKKKVVKRKTTKSAAPKKTASKPKRNTVKRTAKKAAPAKSTKSTKKKPAKKRARKPAPSSPQGAATFSKEASAHRNWNWDFDNDTVIASFAKNLNEAIAAADISHGQLAREINYSRIAISNMTRGLNGATLPTLLRICSVLKVTPNDLLRKRG